MQAHRHAHTGMCELVAYLCFIELIIPVSLKLIQLLLEPCLVSMLSSKLLLQLSNPSLILTPETIQNTRLKFIWYNCECTQRSSNAS